MRYNRKAFSNQEQPSVILVTLLSFQWEKNDIRRQSCKGRKCGLRDSPAFYWHQIFHTNRLALERQDNSQKI